MQNLSLCIIGPDDSDPLFSNSEFEISMFPFSKLLMNDFSDALAMILFLLKLILPELLINPSYCPSKLQLLLNKESFIVTSAGLSFWIRTPSLPLNSDSFRIIAPDWSFTITSPSLDMKSALDESTIPQL